MAPVSYPKKRLAWFSTTSFANPVAPWNGGPNQGWGNAGKDAVVGPGLVNFNWSLFKTIAFKEGGVPGLELRFEYFNVFNHTQFSNPDTGISDLTFGQITSTANARILQVALHLMF